MLLCTIKENQDAIQFQGGAQVLLDSISRYPRPACACIMAFIANNGIHTFFRLFADWQRTDD
jgi:hypothetical protein